MAVSFAASIRPMFTDMDVAHMKKDTDLDPLRQRDDFQKLVAELEGKGK